MIDLVQWLTAQLDHDEQIARAATAGPWRVVVDEYAGVYDAKTVESASVLLPDGRPERVIGPGYEGGGVWAKTDAAHIVLHDPPRVLRQVAAHRRVVAEYGRAMDSRRAHRDMASAGALLMAVGTLKLIASVYSDRPGYDPSWTGEP